MIIRLLNPKIQVKFPFNATKQKIRRQEISTVPEDHTQIWRLVQESCESEGGWSNI